MIIVIVCIWLAQGFGVIWRHGLVGVGMALLDKVVTVDVNFKTLILATWKPMFSCLSSEQNVEHLDLPTSCQPGCCHAPALMITDRTFEPVHQPQLNVSL